MLQAALKPLCPSVTQNEQDELDYTNPKNRRNFSSSVGVSFRKMRMNPITLIREIVVMSVSLSECDSE